MPMWTPHVAVLVAVLLQLQEVRAFNPCGHHEIFWKTANPANYSCLRCPSCPEGTEPSIICGSTVDYGTPLHCVPCRTGTYSDKFDTNPCRLCTICSDGKGQRRRLRSCTRTSNTVCRKNCQAGYYKNFVFSCVQCPRCCKSNLHMSGCEKKECQAHQSCPSEPSTGAPTNTDAVSTSSTPSSSLMKQRQSSVPTTSKQQTTNNSKSALQLQTNSVLLTQNIIMSPTTKRVEQSSRNSPSTSPWRKLKSQVFNSTRGTVPHFIRSQDNFVAYIVIALCVVILLCSLLVCMLAYRRGRKTDPGKSTETGNKQVNADAQSIGTGDEQTAPPKAMASPVVTANKKSTTVTSIGDLPSTAAAMVTSNEQFLAPTAPTVGDKTEKTESRNTADKSICGTPHTDKMKLSDFADTHYNAFDKVCELLDTKIPGSANYENVAKHYGVKQCTIKSRFATHGDGPSKALFEWLGGQNPELTVEKFIDVLRSEGIERNDVAVTFLCESEK